MSAGIPGIGNWLPVKDGDPRAAAIYRRHYSAYEYRDGRRSRYGAKNRFHIAGPGEKLLLMTVNCDALFVWRKFIDDSGQVARERLNWVSPQKGILVFSNHRAARAISISPEALARQIRDGAARIVDDSSFFDRAIDGVMRSLNVA